jgi:hypothetical protein
MLNLSDPATFASVMDLRPPPLCTVNTHEEFMRARVCCISELPTAASAPS